MKTLTYQGSYRLGKLHDELIAAIPALAPVGEGIDTEALFTIGGDETFVAVTVPDQTGEPAVAAVVAAHDPTTPGPAEQEQITETENETTINEHLEQRLPVLQAIRDGITANPPTMFEMLPNQERVALRDIINQEIGLTRLTLQLLEDVD